MGALVPNLTALFSFLAADSAAGIGGVGSAIHQNMSPNNDLISETLRDPKHPFRAAGDRPRKSQKHRYERRKAREFIKITDWSLDTATA
jgi:hypothetical protein